MDVYDFDVYDFDTFCNDGVQPNIQSLRKDKKTPSKRGEQVMNKAAKDAEYREFMKREMYLLSLIYPFLPQSQIRGKAKERWQRHQRKAETSMEEIKAEKTNVCHSVIQNTEVIVEKKTKYKKQSLKKESLHETSSWKKSRSVSFLEPAEEIFLSPNCETSSITKETWSKVRKQSAENRNSTRKSTKGRKAAQVSQKINSKGPNGRGRGRLKTTTAKSIRQNTKKGPKCKPTRKQLMQEAKSASEKLRIQKPDMSSSSVYGKSSDVAHRSESMPLQNTGTQYFKKGGREKCRKRDEDSYSDSWIENSPTFNDDKAKKSDSSVQSHEKSSINLTETPKPRSLYKPKVDHPRAYTNPPDYTCSKQIKPRRIEDGFTKLPDSELEQMTSDKSATMPPTTSAEVIDHKKGQKSSNPNKSSLRVSYSYRQYSIPDNSTDVQISSSSETFVLSPTMESEVERKSVHSSNAVKGNQKAASSGTCFSKTPGRNSDSYCSDKDSSNSKSLALASGDSEFSNSCKKFKNGNLGQVHPGNASSVQEITKNTSNSFLEEDCQNYSLSTALRQKFYLEVNRCQKDEFRSKISSRKPVSSTKNHSGKDVNHDDKNLNEKASLDDVQGSTKRRRLSVRLPHDGLNTQSKQNEICTKYPKRSSSKVVDYYISSDDGSSENDSEITGAGPVSEIPISKETHAPKSTKIMSLKDEDILILKEAQPSCVLGLRFPTLSGDHEDPISNHSHQISNKEECKIFDLESSCSKSDTTLHPSESDFAIKHCRNDTQDMSSSFEARESEKYKYTLFKDPPELTSEIHIRSLSDQGKIPKVSTKHFLGKVNFYFGADSDNEISLPGKSALSFVGSDSISESKEHECEFEPPLPATLSLFEANISPIVSSLEDSSHCADDKSHDSAFYPNYDHNPKSVTTTLSKQKVIGVKKSETRFDENKSDDLMERVSSPYSGCGKRKFDTALKSSPGRKKGKKCFITNVGLDSAFSSDGSLISYKKGKDWTVHLKNGDDKVPSISNFSNVLSEKSVPQSVKDTTQSKTKMIFEKNRSSNIHIFNKENEPKIKQVPVNKVKQSKADETTSPEKAYKSSYTFSATKGKDYTDQHHFQSSLKCPSADKMSDMFEDTDIDSFDSPNESSLWKKDITSQDRCKTRSSSSASIKQNTRYDIPVDWFTVRSPNTSFKSLSGGDTSDLVHDAVVSLRKITSLFLETSNVTADDSDEDRLSSASSIDLAEVSHHSKELPSPKMQQTDVFKTAKSTKVTSFLKVMPTSSFLGDSSISQFKELRQSGSESSSSPITNFCLFDSNLLPVANSAKKDSNHHVDNKDNSLVCYGKNYLRDEPTKPAKTILSKQKAAKPDTNVEKSSSRGCKSNSNEQLKLMKRPHFEYDKGKIDITSKSGFDQQSEKNHDIINEDSASDVDSRHPLTSMKGDVESMLCVRKKGDESSHVPTNKMTPESKDEASKLKAGDVSDASSFNAFEDETSKESDEQTFSKTKSSYWFQSYDEGDICTSSSEMSPVLSKRKLELEKVGISLLIESPILKDDDDAVLSIPTDLRDRDNVDDSIQDLLSEIEEASLF